MWVDNDDYQLKRSGPIWPKLIYASRLIDPPGNALVLVYLFVLQPLAILDSPVQRNNTAQEDNTEPKWLVVNFSSYE